MLASNFAPSQQKKITFPATAVPAVRMFPAVVQVNAPPGMIFRHMPTPHPGGFVMPVAAEVPVSVRKIVPVGTITPAGTVYTVPSTGRKESVTLPQPPAKQVYFLPENTKTSGRNNS